jgi:cytochrome c
MKKLNVLLPVAFGLVLVATAATAGAPTAESGKRIWNAKENKCAACHGEDGKGKTKIGTKMGLADMTTAAWQAKFNDQQIKDAILKGVDREEAGKKVKMKPMEGATADDATALLKFIRTFAAAEAPKPAPKEAPKDAPKEAPKDAPKAGPKDAPKTK